MHVPVLWDLDKRIKMMKKWPGYQQVLTLSMPAIEFLGMPEQSPEFARLANDGMAEIVQQASGPVSLLRRLAADEQRAGLRSRRWTAPSASSAPRASRSSPT